MDKKGFLKGIGGRNVFLLGLVSLLNDFSSEMILPILPFFILALGGGGVALGVIGGMMLGLPNLLNFFIGFYSDKTQKRKSIICSGYLLSQLSKLALFFSSSSIFTFICTSSDKVGKAVREAPRDALISESLPNEKGKAFGIQRAFDSTGAILGSLAVLSIVLFFGITLKDAGFFRNIILLASLIGFFSLIPLFFLKEPRFKALSGGKIFRNIGKNKKLIYFLIASFIFALGNFSYMLFITKAGVSDGNNLAATLGLYVLFNLFYTVFAVPFGKLSDRIGRRKVLSAGFILYALVCLGFILFDSYSVYLILFAFYGMVYAIVVGIQRAFISDLSAENERATALGAFQATIGISAIIGGFIAGNLYNIDSDYAFIFGSLCSFISFLILILSFRNHVK